MNKATRLPVLQGILPFSWAHVPRDVTAGLTLAALAIPEVMGYTRISGTPVVTGLYTLLLPALLYALFGSSRHLVVGADSATAAILASGLIGIAARGSEEYVALAAVLAGMAGGFLLLARVVRLGFLADFLSRTVLIGFLTGVGVQVALSQLAGMLGIPDQAHGTLARLTSLFHHLTAFNGYACALAAATLLITVSLKGWSRRVPGALIAVVVAIVASWAFRLEHHVVVLGKVPGGLPSFQLPHVTWSWALVPKLMPTAFSMFVVILAQSAATARAYATRYGEDVDENEDLVGLGLANVAACLTGAFVVNGSPTKTQMVDSAGGRSQIALVVTTIVVLFVLLFFTAPLAYLPEAVLSAIVFLIGLELIDTKGMRRIYTQRRAEFWVAGITSLMVIFVGVEQGILLAIVLSLVDHTRRGYHPKNAVLIKNHAGSWRPQSVETGAQAAPGLIVYRFTHSMYYANCQQMADEILDLVDHADPPLRCLCIDGSAIDDVDYSAQETLRGILETLRARGIRLVVAQLMTDVKAGQELRALLPPGDIYEDVDEVVEEYRR